MRRDDVVDAALALLDEDGLDALTTRRLADRLGVRVGALYWHVQDKRDLLISLADRIVAEALPGGDPDCEDWTAQVTDAAQRLRAAMLRHRDGARLVAGYAPFGRAGLCMADAGLRAMRSLGLPLPAAACAGDALMSYVTGFVLQEQTAPVDGGRWLDAGCLADFPALAEWTAVCPPDREGAFAAGLRLILAGTRASFADGPPTKAPGAVSDASG